MDKVKGLVDEEMYKRIYDKTKQEINRLNGVVKILENSIEAQYLTKLFYTFSLKFSTKKAESS